MTPSGGQCSCTSSTPSINSNSAAVSSSPSPGHADNRLFFTESPMLLPKERSTYPYPSIFNESERNTLKKSAYFDTKLTIINKGNYTMPKHGEAPDFCHKPYVDAIDSTGQYGRKRLYTCKTARCPMCGDLWIHKAVFKATVNAEAYAQATGSRPSRYVSSVAIPSGSSGIEYTLDDIRKLRRNTNDRLKRCGVTAGSSLFHAMRIKKRVKTALKRYLKDPYAPSSAFWDAILNDPECIAYINTHVGNDLIKYESWRDCVNLSPHYHGLAFPGTQKFTGDKKIMIRKLITNRRDNETGKITKIYTLKTASDVVKHVSYLLSHAGILINAGKHQMQPMTSFGELHNLNPADIVSEDDLHNIKKEVLHIMNAGRNNGFMLDQDGELCHQHNDDQEEHTWKPLYDIASMAEDKYREMREWLGSLPDQENARYIMHLIELHHAVRGDDQRKAKYRKIFIDEAPPPPPNFEYIFASDGDTDE